MHEFLLHGRTFVRQCLLACQSIKEEERYDGNECGDSWVQQRDVHTLDHPKRFQCDLHPEGNLGSKNQEQL